MNYKMENNLTLSEVSMNGLKQRMEELSAQGVKASSAHSKELNFAGCASGYCQAWD